MLGFGPVIDGFAMCFADWSRRTLVPLMTNGDDDGTALDGLSGSGSS